MCEPSERLRDVADASAACLVQMLSEYAALNSRELFERVKDHFEVALTAYIDAVDG